MTSRELARTSAYGLAWMEADARLESQVTCEDAVRCVLSVLADGMPLGEFLDTLKAMYPEWSLGEITRAVNRVGPILTPDGRVVLDRRQG